MATPTTADGFETDITWPAGAAASLARFPFAVTSREGKLSVFELARVIGRHNTRAGTTHIAQCHAQENTEDGFAPAP